MKGRIPTVVQWILWTALYHFVINPEWTTLEWMLMATLSTCMCELSDIRYAIERKKP